MNNQYIEILKQNTRQEITHRFIPKSNEKFFFIDPINGMIIEINRILNYDNCKFAKCFKTEEEAQKHLDFLLAEDFLKQKAFEINDGWEPNWNNENQPKFYIYYNYSNNKFNINSFCQHNCNHNIIYLKDDSDAQTMINLYSKELKTYFGVLDEQ